MSVSFMVYGMPAAAGSKRHVGGGRMIESSKKVAPWRQDVAAAARIALDAIGPWEPFCGPVVVTATYYFPRPKSHYRTGKHAGELKANAPSYVSTKPDIEKVTRSTHDALTTAGLWRDDSLVVDLHVFKRYGDLPGVHLSIAALDEGIEDE